jgi:capsular polysaccharide biosynthesis protein
MEEELSFYDVIAILRKHWKFIIGLSLLLSAVVFAALWFMPKKYQSYSIVRIGYVGNSPLRAFSEIETVMSSQHMVKEILGKLNMPVSRENINKVKNVYKFEDNGRLLKITAICNGSDEALGYVKAITEILLELHGKIYEEEQQRLYESIKTVKKIISPTPLVTSVNDIVAINIPTEIEIQPQKDDIPLPARKAITALIVFFLSVFCLTLASFIKEGLGKAS